MVAIEVQSASVRAVILSQEKGRWQIGRFSEIPLGGVGEMGKIPDPLREACFEAVGSLGDALIISSVPAPDVLARQLDIPVSKDKEIQAVRNFQVEPLLPFGIEEAVLDHEVLERKKDGVRLVVLSVLKERIAEHLEQMKEAGLEPEKVSCVPVALARLVYHLVPSKEAVGVLHLGQDATSCLIVREGLVVRSRVFPLGAHHLKEVLPKDVALDFMNFEPTSGPLVKQRAESFRAEIAKTFFSMTHRGNDPINQIFVSGEFDSFRNLDVYLAQGIDHPIVQLPQRSNLCDHEFRTARYAVPLGMLLDHLPKVRGEGVCAIDFRKEAFSYPRPWRRARKKIAFYLLSSLLTALLMLGGGEGFLRKKKAALSATYGHLTENAGDVDSLLQGARSYIRRLNGEVESYPLEPDLPKVQDVLSYLESHPQMEGIKVDAFHYSLVKRPDHRRPNEPYQAKVELELTTKSPTQARELHDALRAPDKMIDQKHDLQWNTQGDKVKCAFVLKDYTRYPGKRA